MRGVKQDRPINLKALSSLTPVEKITAIEAYLQQRLKLARQFGNREEIKDIEANLEQVRLTKDYFLGQEPLVEDKMS